MRFGGVYMLVNRVTGDSYVGITTQTVARRWREHGYKANGRSCCTWRHRAIRKYTPHAFDVVEIASAKTRSALLELEIAVIKDRTPTYNQSHGGEGTTGRKFTPDVLAARNAKLRGRVKSPEERARISEGCKAAMTPERREASIAILLKARSLIDEDKRRVSAGNAARGRVWSAETRAKLSAACMGRRHPQEVIDRMRMSKMKPVVCENNGVRYTNAKEAAEALCVGHRSVIRVLKGKYPAVKGLTFSYGE